MEKSNETKAINMDLLVEADSFFDEKFKKKMRLSLLLVDLQCKFILVKASIKSRFKRES